MYERTTDHAQRATMIERHLAGASLPQIAADLHLNRLAHRGQVVKVRFEPQTAEFVLRTLADEELCRFTLPVISADYILGDCPGGTQLVNV